ncbi:hypothetical protein D3C72_1041460 [compost metagenome]
MHGEMRVEDRGIGFIRRVVQKNRCIIDNDADRSQRRRGLFDEPRSGPGLCQIRLDGNGFAAFLPYFVSEFLGLRHRFIGMDGDREAMGGQIGGDCPPKPAGGPRYQDCLRYIFFHGGPAFAHLSPICWI